MKKDGSPEGEWLQRRSAGVLMHITSLSGSAHTGDIGTAARKFVDFLVDAGQSVWQLLPLNPTTSDQSYSPYSSSSAMAANPLLIDVDWLKKKFQLRLDLRAGTKTTATKADFKKAEEFKNDVLHEAWRQWTKIEKNKSAFKRFCADEGYWLNDFAMYSVLKKNFNNAPWYEWPRQFKNREAKAISNFRRESQHGSEIEKVQFIQFVFHLQWRELRDYCNQRGIKLMGDMPMYVAHDSADVWAHRNIFTLRNDGTMSEVSGVPPDLFNDDGQLWGTPLFKWDTLKATKYKWWIDRFRRNFQLFDLLRLDHFRAFSSYWSVKAGAKNAKGGKWKRGPGTDVFKAAQRSLGKLPLIAEDLGEIDAPVYALRDELKLPGMNVLQFGFSDEKLDNDYLPHRHISNSLVYTGTHDNNTTVGWYTSSTSPVRKNISAYAGVAINAANVSEYFCRLAYQSVSKLAILPVQDILSLDERSRMNMPATAAGNWTWRVGNNALTGKVANQLKSWVKLYGR